MTEAPANKITATVETIRISRRAEETARVFAQLSFPVKGREHILTLLAGQLKNGIDLTMEEIQARLPEPVAADQPDAEVTTMIVDGEPAKVRRPRRNASSNGASADWQPHAFLESTDTPGLCAKCHLRESAEHHELVALPHVFVTHDADDQCAWCHLAADNDRHAVDEGLSDLAKGLLEDVHEEARRTPETEQEAEEQEAAEARLAAKSGA